MLKTAFLRRISSPSGGTVTHTNGGWLRVLGEAWSPTKGGIVGSPPASQQFATVVSGPPCRHLWGCRSVGPGVVFEVRPTMGRPRRWGTWPWCP